MSNSLTKRTRNSGRYISFRCLCPGRYHASLHRVAAYTFISKALRETAYAYSGKVVVDSALRIWYAANSSWQTGTAHFVHSHNRTTLSTGGDFDRFTVSGSRFFRTAAFQASLIIAVE